MPTLTGLPALIKRAQVLAGSALTALSALLAVLVVLAQQLEQFGGVPEWATKGIASAIAVIGVAVFQVRRVTPVSDVDKGLLPPKGPAAEADPGRDVGNAELGLLFTLIALACFVVVLVIGAGWVTSTVIFAWLGGGLAAWVLAGFFGRPGPPA